MNRKFLLISVLLTTAVLFLVACGGAEPTAEPVTVEPTQEIPATFTPIPEPTALTEPLFGLATVESVQILTLESFPVQINVQVRGVLPNGCTEIDNIITQTDGSHFDIAITTVQQPDTICTDAVVPFEEMVPLEVEDLDAGTYTVTVNGVQGSFTLDVDNRMPAEAVAAAAINGIVWHDLCAPPGEDGEASEGCITTADGGFEANGLLDSGEPGIGGVTVSLGEGECPSSGVATTVTENDGSYSFTELAAGDYCVSIDTLGDSNQAILIPGGWTFPESGIPETAVTLTEGEASDPVDFGWDYEFLPLPAGTNSCENNTFEYVQDLNIPDNTTFTPGAEFTKMWELRNNSECVWTTEYSIVFVGGDQMSAPESVPLERPVAPGETIDIAIDMIAPAFRQESYRGNWQMADPAGEPFGINGVIEDAFWLQIQVRETAEPQATAVPNSAVIGGVVWDDFCNNATGGSGCAEYPENSGIYVANGTLSGNEARLQGITMSLSGGVCTPGNFPQASTVIQTAVTDEFGNYIFDSLPAGSYCVFMDALSSDNVNFLIPGNWTWPAIGVGQQTVVLIEGEEALDIDFGWDYQ
ncbi:MAG: hypothetical protein IAF02_08230 [Anaerolineae bacterium]|nr:hypothetical protein [Anaerolineae bacterium]